MRLHSDVSVRKWCPRTADSSYHEHSTQSVQLLGMSLEQFILTYEPPRGKTNNVVSEQGRHKPTCTSTEAGQKLEILDLSRREIALSSSENKFIDQLRSYWETDLRLCFCLCRLLVFPCGGSMLFCKKILNTGYGNIKVGAKP